MALLAPHQDGIDRFEIRSPNADIHKHSRLIDYKSQLRPELYAGLFKFTSVRNPWDRCVSHYFSPHRGQVEWTAAKFERFIEEEVNQIEYYLDLDDGVDPFTKIDAYIRFENLEEDFKNVCKEIDIKAPDLPFSNSSRHKKYQYYYEKSGATELIQNKFSGEIDFFEYRFQAD